QVDSSIWRCMRLNIVHSSRFFRSARYSTICGNGALMYADVANVFCSMSAAFAQEPGVAAGRGGTDQGVEEDVHDDRSGMFERRPKSIAQLVRAPDGDS